MIKNKLLLIAVCTVILSVLLTGCEDDNSKTNKSGDETPSVSSSVIFKNLPGIYGNGTDMVSYKGQIYYIEFKTNDFTEEAIGAPEYFVIENSNNQRMVNTIDDKGNIINLFKLTGVNNLTIVNNRFFLKSNNGVLYTVNMKGEDNIDLGKGDYLGFDEDGGAVYYQNTSDVDLLFKMDTKTLSISHDEFDNPLKMSGFNFLGVRNDNLYYSYLDKINSKLILMEHNIKDNVQQEVASLIISLKEKEYNNKAVSDFVVCTYNIGRYSGLCIGTPSEGSMGGFYDKAIYTFDLEAKTIDKVAGTGKKNDTDWYSEDMLRKALIQEVYKLADVSFQMPSISTLFTEKDKEEFAQKYNIDLEEKLGEEGKNLLASDPETEKYKVEIEDYSIVGNNILYKVTASRCNPLNEVGWRPAYVRMCSEVYLKSMATNKSVFVYPIINTNYGDIEAEILQAFMVESGDMSGDVSGDVSGEISGEVSGEASGEIIVPEPVKEEFLVELDTEQIDLNEFDLRIEETGGSIIGKRVEYEGHRRKSEKKIRVRITQEPGVTFTIYIDNEEIYSYTFE